MKKFKIKKIRKPLKVRKILNKGLIALFATNGFSIGIPFRGVAYGFLASNGNSEFEVHYLNEGPHVMVDWKLNHKKAPKFGHEEFKTDSEVLHSALDFLERWKRALKKAKED